MCFECIIRELINYLIFNYIRLNYRGLIYAQFLMSFLLQFLNQVCAGHRPVRAWFLKIDPVWIVGMRACVCVCPRPRLLITSGMI